MALTEDQEVTLERPTCCSYAAGRVFMGMKNSLYYSQLMEGESVDFLNRCFSKNDPTAEQLSDVLDTDGGVIQINEAINITQVEAFSNGIVVYAQNGVWYVGGPSTGFTATNFFIEKVSEAGIASPQSVITVESNQFFWSLEGIFMLATNEFGKVETSSLIEDTMQSFYNDISVEAKTNSSGVYNRLKKQIEWFYSSGTQSAVTDYKYAKNLSLIYDVRTGGLWPQQYNSVMSEAAGSTLIGGVSTNSSTEDAEITYLTIDMGTPTSTQTYSVDFAYKTNIEFKDYSANYTTAFVETGFESLEKPSNAKAAPSVMMHFRQTEENFVADGSGGLKLDLQSGCQLRSKWDWNDSSANGRWGPTQQAYRFRRMYIPDIAGPFLSGETVISTKLKVLGRGKALSLRFEQEANKDMKILGYTTVYNMKGKP